MRRIVELLDEIDGREIVEMEMKSALKDYNVDWTQFWVLKDYEKVVKGILSKAETWYLICAAHEVEINMINARNVKLSVVELKDWEIEEFVSIPKPFRRTRRNYMDVMIHVSPENMKKLMK